MATRKELFERIKDTMADDPEVVEMCGKYIEQMSKPRETKASKAAAEFAETVYEYMRTLPEPVTNRALVQYFEENGQKVSGQKITGALRKLRTQGRVEMIMEKKSAEPYTYQVI